MRKLVITNSTEWDTRALRSVFLKVINENIKYEGPLRHTIRARVIYTRRWGYSGYAYFHSGLMTIRLPRRDEVIDVFKLGYLFEHELAHCRGYKHKGMCSLNSWASATAEKYPYLVGMDVGRRVKRAKPMIDVKAVRYARVLTAIKVWETKAKRAKTALRKLAAKRKYYETRLGESHGV